MGRYEKPHGLAQTMMATHAGWKKMRPSLNMSIASSQGSADARGIPQSCIPGIGGGLRRLRIFNNSDRSPNLSSE